MEVVAVVVVVVVVWGYLEAARRAETLKFRAAQKRPSISEAGRRCTVEALN